MKITPPLFISRYLNKGHYPENGRKPQLSLKIPYSGILPLSLRNTVSGKGEKSSGTPCLSEIAAVLACLKANDFEEKNCLKEAATVRSCEENYKRNLKLMQAQEREGTLKPGSRNLSRRQMTKLLEKFPQPGITR